MTIGLIKISCLNDRLIPLGLACLQAYLKAHQIDVKVCNFRAQEYTLPKVASDPLIQLKPPTFIMNHQDFPILVPIIANILDGQEVNLNEDIFPDILKDYAQRLGESSSITRTRFENIITYLKDQVLDSLMQFDSIGFSVNYLNIPETLIASSLIKRISPITKVIWGGPSITQSTDAFKLFLKMGACDGLIIGEGEFAMLEFAQGKELKDIRGMMSMRDESDVYYDPGIQLDLDSLPTPDYTDIPLDTYFQIASVYRSRGCTHRCKFCAEWKLFGRRFRVRSIESVIKDVEMIMKNHSPQYLIFGESLVNDDLTYFEKLCDALIEKDFGMNFGTHFRANITPELARKAFEAGFNDAWVGFEAFSDDDLKEMNKGTSVNQNMATIKNLTQAGINVIAMLVVGFSNLEEEEKNCDNILQTIAHFSRENLSGENGKFNPIPIQWRPAPMYIVPGSLDYQEKKSTHTWSWKCKSVSFQNILEIRILEDQLSDIPYEFERPIPDEKVGELMRKVQKADRNSKFAIGGLARHIINYIIEVRRNNRKKRKFERFGVIAQRFNKEILET